MWILIGSIAVLWFVYSAFENWKKKNPEKWARMERQNWEWQAKDFAEAYDRVTRRVPNSRWILMTRKEKSDIFAERERLEEKFSLLPMEVRKILAEKYGLGPDFPSKSKYPFSK